MNCAMQIRTRTTHLFVSRVLNGISIQDRRSWGASRVAETDGSVRLRGTNGLKSARVGAAAASLVCVSVRPRREHGEQATATKLRKLGSGQCSSAAPSNHEGSTRKTIPVMSTSPNQPTTRNSVASTIAEKPSSGRPSAGREVEHVPCHPEDERPEQDRRGHRRERDGEPAGATSAPIPRTRSTMLRTGFTCAV